MFYCIYCVLRFFLARLNKGQEELFCTPPGVSVSKMLHFYVKVFYVMGKALTDELSCPCDRSCFFSKSIKNSCLTISLDVSRLLRLFLKRKKAMSYSRIIDKISSLSCQKVADSITSSKMGNNEAKQASVLLCYIPEYIRRYPSAYCTI